MRELLLHAFLRIWAPSACQPFEAFGRDDRLVRSAIPERGPTMLNNFSKHPLWECHKTLIRVAQGQEPADIVLRHVTLVSVTTHELLEDADIAIAAGRVAYIGIEGHTAEHCIGEKTEVFDLAGAYVAPAFMDGHIHVESAMVGPAEYACAVVPHGTSAIMWDPHEAMNVAGIEALDVLMKDAERVPLKCYVTPGSCVPAVPGFEDTGATIDAADIHEAMKRDEICGLGEMMNDPGVLSCADGPLAEIEETLKAGKTVTGHYTMRDTDRGLEAYIASGVSCCHESVTREEALAKLRCGQYAQLREGSAWQNLKELAHAVTDNEIDTRFVNLVTDDSHPETLVSEGHIDRILKKAVAFGIDPVSAIQMVTINVAQCFDLAQDLGSVTPGKCADIVVLDDLKDFCARLVFIDGELVAKDGQALFAPKPYAWPAKSLHTMHITDEISADTFKIPALKKDGSVLPDGKAYVRVIASSAGSTLTKEEHLEVPVRDGALLADPAQDVLKAFVFDRHHEGGQHACAFARGFGIHGALAQTVAHDAHNLLVVGDSDEDMAIAARELIASGGGEVAVQDGKILGKVALPLFGIMSTSPIEKVAHDVAGIEAAWKKMGCTMPSPFMTMGLLSLACIPELRLTDRGLVDCCRYCFVPLLVEDGD